MDFQYLVDEKEEKFYPVGHAKGTIYKNTTTVASALDKTIVDLEISDGSLTYTKEDGTTKSLRISGGKVISAAKIDEICV